MSLIEKALERAKEMGMARQGRAAPAPRAHRDVQATKEPATVANGAPARPQTGWESMPPLGRIEFDYAACNRNHVLFDQTQLASAGRAAASYRLLRGRLLQRLKGSESPCIGITSAGPGDGKSLTSLNLAIHVARDRQHPVFLLDLDMRSPRIFASVGVRPPHGLAEFLAGSARPEDVLYDTSVDHLTIAGVSDPIQGASELLASTRLDELLAFVRQRAPGAVIVCDLPPVLSTDEALLVAPRTDSLVLVVSEGVTRRDALARAIDMLGDFQLAGIILNRSSEDPGKDYYGY